MSRQELQITAILGEVFIVTLRYTVTLLPLASTDTDFDVYLSL